MADDRLHGDEQPLTHEFLSNMLGDQRSRCNTRPARPCARRLISTRRGRITINDRKALEKNANGTLHVSFIEKGAGQLAGTFVG